MGGGTFWRIMPGRLSVEDIADLFWNSQSMGRNTSAVKSMRGGVGCIAPGGSSRLVGTLLSGSTGLQGASNMEWRPNSPSPTGRPSALGARRGGRSSSSVSVSESRPLRAMKAAKLSRLASSAVAP